ncbi:MAG: GIY-YIG nuclease [Robiginitomaculum sp.]|nr:MAG: GIY-YIG nuclease [Robiginitomaculum sp.]
MSRTNWVYMMTNQRNGTLYVGSTSNLIARIDQHRNGTVEGFTKKYGLTRLVWAEECADMETALSAEHRIKKWRRKWKLDLIEKHNPEWDDLWETISK